MICENSLKKRNLYLQYRQKIKNVKKLKKVEKSHFFKKDIQFFKSIRDISLMKNDDFSTFS